MGADSPENAPLDDEGQSFISHLVELRARLLKCVVAVLVVFIALMPFSNDLYTGLARPLLDKLGGTSMIATEVAAPFLVPFKLTLFVAAAVAAPYIFYQAWRFIAPGLYRHERRLAGPLIASSTALFYLGMVFAYYLVFPLMFGFFTAAAPNGVAVMTDISRYLGFVMKIFLAFGIAFEVPIATFLLVRSGMVEVDDLAGKRPYVIVGAFGVGMLLTPPDVVSQFLLAIPVWLLFELGLVLARVVGGGPDPEGFDAD